MQICKYNVNSRVISYSTCQKEEKKFLWVLYLIHAVLLQFKILRNLHVFFAKSLFTKIQKFNGVQKQQIPKSEMYVFSKKKTEEYGVFF